MLQHHPLRNIMAPSALEKKYGICDLAELWRLGRVTVRKLVKDDPGVLKIQMGRNKSNIYYSVPESVAQRIYTRLLNGKLLAARSRRIYERILKDLG